MSANNINRTISEALVHLNIELNSKSKDLDTRVTALENAPSNDQEVKKQTLKLYKQLGDADPALKPFTDELRLSMIGLKDFAKLGTGLFIHWGIYAVPAGNYTGPKQTGSTITATSTNYNTEWIMRDLGIPRDVYKAYQDLFTAENWDPMAICKAASEAGMGYVVITMKHHDGFSLYPTEYGHWDVRTSAARDTIVDELKAACDLYQLKFGVYYSHYWDWMEEGGFGLNVASKKGGYWNGSSADMYTADEHEEYCNNAALQISEIVDKYEPYILWYDPGANYAQTYKNIFIQSEYDNYPHIIVNDRLDYNRSRGDYGTGERTIYLKNTLKYGEACFTMNNTWGYSDNNENSYYTHEKVFKEFLLYSNQYGQNCLMNIGPKADGSIPTKQLECLTSIKNFFDKYGSLKDYTRICNNSMPTYGYMTELAHYKFACYIITKGNPSNQNVVISNVNTDHISKVEILTGNADASYEIRDNRIYVSNLGLDSDTKVGVVIIHYSKQPTILDANRVAHNELLPSRSFPIINGVGYNFSNLNYEFKPLSGSYLTTDIVFDGDTNDYFIDLSFTTTLNDDTTTVTLTDESGVEQTITYANSASTSETYVSLVNGERYTIKYKVEGTSNSTSYKFNGLTFTPRTVIVHPDSVTLNESTITVEVEGTQQLTATVLPEDANNKAVTWSSSNEAIATVEDGLVIGVAAGECDITVTTVDGGLTASCHVLISVPEEEVVHVDSITISQTTLTMIFGETATITAEALPAHATYRGIAWETNNPLVATVENGVITAVGIGSAIITARSTYDTDKYNTCIVTVSGVPVESVSFDKTSITLIPGFSDKLTVTVLPTDATNKDINWSISDPLAATIDDEGNIFAMKAGNITITATSVDGAKTATCNVTINAETYDYLWERLSLDGTDGQGDDTGIKLFSDAEDMQQWTLFGYVHDSINKYRNGTTSIETNQTLYQCVVDASPWSGLRVDANSNVNKTTLDLHIPMRFRFMAGTDNYVNATTGELMGNSIVESASAPKHPLCITRNGDTYSFTADGYNWTTFAGLNSAQLARLKECILTVGFDYTRSGGLITTTEYRHLKTDNPCCVAFKKEYQYPFYTLYQKYDSTIHVACADIIIDTNDIELTPGQTYQLQPTINPAHCTSIIVYSSSDESNVTVSSNGLLTYVSTGTADITITCDEVVKTIHVICHADTNYHDVNTNLTGVTLNPDDITEVEDGGQYNVSLALTDPDNTIISSVTVEMGSVDITEEAYHSDTQTILINSVTDELTITATATDKLTITFTMDAPITLDGVQYQNGDLLTISTPDKINWLQSIL